MRQAGQDRFRVRRVEKINLARFTVRSKCWHDACHVRGGAFSIPLSSARQHYAVNITLTILLIALAQGSGVDSVVSGIPAQA